MDRRTLLTSVASVAVAGTGGLAGCSSGRDSTGTTPTATTRRETAGLSATVTTVSYDGTAGEHAEAVSLATDCEAGTATLRGWLSTSSCRTVAIRTLRYDRAERVARLVLFPRWTESEPPESVDCAGASYRYSIELTARERLPTEVRVRYARPDERASAAFTARTDDCP